MFEIRITHSLQALTLWIFVSGFCGCATLRSMISNEDKPNSTQAGCTCGDSICANCSAPIGCGSTPYVSEMQIPEMHLPPVGHQSESEQWAPRTAWLPPAQPSRHMPNLPQNTVVRDPQLEAAKSELSAKLEILESRFEAEKHAKTSLTSSLEAMNSEVSRLSREVEFWRDEVRRIDRTTEMQHRSDMASLQSISQMIDSLAAPSTGTAPE